MSTPLTFQTACQAKNPSTCRNHGKVATLRKLMNDAESEQDYEAYFQARKDFESVTGTILLEEMQDYDQYDEMFADELDEAERRENQISKQLMMMHRKADYQGMTWTKFAKWAVQVRNPQSYGAILEKRYIHELGAEKVKSSEAQGDFLNLKTGKYTEFKVSVANPLTKRSVNFVQIRPHHKVDDYHLVIVDKNTGKSELFVITKAKMAKELEANGGLAHGRVADATHDKTEFAIRFSATKTDAVYKQWKIDYAKPFPTK